MTRFGQICCCSGCRRLTDDSCVINSLREKVPGVQPRAVHAIDFDIVHTNTSPMVPDAEVIKVVEEILDEFPPYKSGGFCFLINHVGITDAIFDSCHVPLESR